MMAALLAGSARAQIASSWVGLDAYTTLTYTTIDVNVPTGYWYGNYAYNWGGYYWPAYLGWYYPLTDPNVSPYVSRYGLGWGGYAGWLGFTDWYDYTYSSLTAQTVYTWSIYDVRQNQSMYVWDIYTGVNGTQVMPFSTASQASVYWTPHYWYYNGGYLTGLFTPNADVIASTSAITSWLIANGATSYEITMILGSQIVVDAIAANNNGLGSDSIWIQVADVPEPTTVSLLLLAGLVLVIKRKL
jgi:hypothetical protein